MSIRTQLASDIRRDILAGEVYQDDHLVAEVFEKDGAWTLNLFDAQVEPNEFVRGLRHVMGRLKTPRRSN